jgi:hypothetical protein
MIRPFCLGQMEYVKSVSIKPYAHQQEYVDVIHNFRSAAYIDQAVHLTK